MNAQTMLDMLRTLTTTDSTTLPDATGLAFLNFSYKKRVAKWKQDVNEDYWAEIYGTTLIPYQCEYPLPVNTSTFTGCDDILGISVNYATPVAGTGTISGSAGSSTVTGVGTDFTQLLGKTLDTGTYRGVVVAVASGTSCTVDTPIVTLFSGVSFNYYLDNWQKCTQFRMNNADKDESWYRANQPKTAPLWSTFDDSFFIYPYHNSQVTGAVKIYGIRTPPDLLLSPAPTSPILDSDFHYSIIIGAKKFVYQLRSMTNEYQAAQVEDTNDMMEMVGIQSERNLSPAYKVNPDYYEFQ